MAKIIARVWDLNGSEVTIFENPDLQKYPDLTTGETVYEIESHYVSKETYEKLVEFLKSLGN